MWRQYAAEAVGNAFAGFRPAGHLLALKSSAEMSCLDSIHRGAASRSLSERFIVNAAATGRPGDRCPPLRHPWFRPPIAIGDLVSAT
jgi:hypothetical protein